MSEIQGKPVYGICACKEKVQVLSVDQVTDLIQQMAANDWQVPEDYIPKTSVNGIVEQNCKDEIKLWVGTQAEYDNLTATEQAGIFAIISDDPTLEEIEAKLKQYGESIENINANITKYFNGIIFGDYIRKKLVWSGSIKATLDSGSQSLKLTETFNTGDRIEIVYRNYSKGNPEIYSAIVPDNGYITLDYVDYKNGSFAFYEMTLKKLYQTNAEVSEITQTPSNTYNPMCEILEIYKYVN